MKRETEQRRGHRIFAAAYEWGSRRSERRGAAERRARLVGDLTGHVLEVGAGNGLNLAYYREVTKVTAVEPDPFMIQRLKKRAAMVAFPVEIVPIGAEALPFLDGSFDAVVASLVLCTIPNPTRALAELRRVLRPDGVFRFMEHVRGDDRRGPIFDAVAPIWSYFSGGCHPNRDTESAVRAAGFEVTSIERYSFGLMPHIFGQAVKSIEKNNHA